MLKRIDLYVELFIVQKRIILKHHKALSYQFTKMKISYFCVYQGFFFLGGGGTPPHLSAHPFGDSLDVPL